MQEELTAFKFSDDDEDEDERTCLVGSYCFVVLNCFLISQVLHSYIFWKRILSGSSIN